MTLIPSGGAERKDRQQRITLAIPAVVQHCNVVSRPASSPPSGERRHRRSLAARRRHSGLTEIEDPVRSVTDVCQAEGVAKDNWTHRDAERILVPGKLFPCESGGCQFRALTDATVVAP